MYRIQAYNLWTKKHEVIYAKTMEDRNAVLKQLRDSPDYGLVTFEYLARGIYAW